jgi:hypothetical protein
LESRSEKVLREVLKEDLKKEEKASEDTEPQEVVLDYELYKTN